MEKLKSIIPSSLKLTIQGSTPNDLPSTCSTLHHFLSHSPLFHSLIQDLTNTELGYFVKNYETALEFKIKANACFCSLHFSQALQFYSQALRVAPADAVEKGNKLIVTLYINRASSLHKLNLFEEAVRDCNRALSINPRYAKAWYRRGKVKASMLKYEESVSDLKIAMKMEGTRSGKKQIESDIKLILDQHTTGSSSSIGVNKLSLIDEALQSKIQCVTTPTKGRGMVSVSDIPPASLLHREEPYAAIILKKCRETHCHFCFDELPADTVPCSTCSMALYCSEKCQLQAGGQMSTKCFTRNLTDDHHCDEIQKCFSEVTLESHSISEIEFAEHGHECRGVNWPSVLPSEVVLAGRILVKLLESQRHSYDTMMMDLSHNYGQLLAESKVEMHVYSVVLLYCLHHSYGPKVQLNGAFVAKIIILISQVKVNSMAIVRMNYQDKYQQLGQHEKISFRDATTSHLEQVKVGQAVYLSGSLFNHSCMPNIHAYFMARTLLMRATELVLTGLPLELSYGPEVGKLIYRERQQFLLDNYSFKCECSGCTTVNFSDLVLNGFHCANSNCNGVVLDHSTAESEKEKIRHLQEIPKADTSMKKYQVDMLNTDDIKNVAPLMFEQSNNSFEIQSGCCLKCGSAHDLTALHAKVDEAEVSIQSLQAAEVHASCSADALNHFEVLKTVLHPYNRKLAKAHDILAEAFFSDAQTQRALDHCLTSIEIVKKLYRQGHIAVGNELLKLSSIQLAAADVCVTDTVNEMDNVFSNYYGQHAEQMFPYLKHLKEEVHNLSNARPEFS